MTKDVLISSPPDLTTEACAWIAQLETGALSYEDLMAFREWIGRSPRHYAEIRRLAELSADANIIADMAGSLKEAAERRRQITNQRKSPGIWGWRAAAALALTLLLAISALVVVSGYPTASYLIATEIGEHRETDLADGSRIHINTDSQIEIDINRSMRKVRLLKGEAYFEVAHNSARPFVVYAGDKRITAVGTAFAVRWTDDDLTVTVTEGRVAFDNADGDAVLNSINGEGAAASKFDAPERLIAAGERLALPKSAKEEAVERVSSKDMTREFSWRSGLLEFDRTPLGDVVKEMERYTPVKIEINDNDLKTLKFGGIFRIGETDAFFDALELSFGVDVIHIDDRHVLLQRAG